MYLPFFISTKEMHRSQLTQKAAVVLIPVFVLHNDQISPYQFAMFLNLFKAVTSASYTQILVALNVHSNIISSN
jgi:hypothetical protein